MNPWTLLVFKCVLCSVSGQTVGDGWDKHFVFGHGHGRLAGAAWHPRWGRILWRIHLDESFFCVSPLCYLTVCPSARLSDSLSLSKASTIYIKNKIEIVVFSQVICQDCQNVPTPPVRNDIFWWMNQLWRQDEFQAKRYCWCWFNSFCVISTTPRMSYGRFITKCVRQKRLCRFFYTF